MFTDSELVNYLTTVREQEAELRAKRHQLVADLRMAGWSWTRIGDALSISKQAAAKTYGESSSQAFSRAMKAIREDAKQVTIHEAILEAETTPVVAEKELAGSTGRCLWSKGCDGFGFGDAQLCDFHEMELDNLDYEVSSAPGEPGSVDCPVCPSEKGESCRTQPTWEPTRNKRPHAKRVSLAKA